MTSAQLTYPAVIGNGKNNSSSYPILWKTITICTSKAIVAKHITICL
jgi:hypothetical protein